MMTTVFELRSRTLTEPGDGCHEGMYATNEKAIKEAEKLRDRW